MSDVIEILKLGRDRLLIEGWCQNALIDPTGARCAVGAVMNYPTLCPAMEEDTEHYEAVYALEKTLHTRGGYPGSPFSSNIVSFNNEPGRTKEEVVELFNDTIAMLEEMTLPGKSVTITVEPIKTTQPAKEPTGPPFEAPNAPVVVPDREPVPA